MGFEPTYTALQAAASPLGHSTTEALPVTAPGAWGSCLRADDGIRTRDPHLGKVMLYQLSHVRTTRAPSPVRCARPELYPTGERGVQPVRPVSGWSQFDPGPGTITRPTPRYRGRVQTTDNASCA